MHAHTTITPFMHDLDIACKNVLISHNFMMHAYACCTCSLISTCTMFPLTLAKKPIIQMTSHDSLMHHYNTPRTRMRSPDQCSISYLFTPPPPPPHNLLPVRIMGYCNKRCQQVIMSTQNVKMCLHQDHTCMTMGLHACQYCTSMYLQWYSR